MGLNLIIIHKYYREYTDSVRSGVFVYIANMVTNNGLSYVYIQ